MAVDGFPPGRLEGDIQLVVVESPDRAAPLVGALDTAGVGAWLWIEAQQALYFSPRVLDLLGLALPPPAAPHRQSLPVSGAGSDLLQKFFASVHHDDRAKVRRILNRDAESGPFVIRYRYLHPDGTYHWIEDRGRVERDAAGQLIRQAGAVRDITEEVAQEHSSAETSARLEALVNSMPFEVWGRSGPDLRVTHMNAAALDTWGDLRGTTLDDVPREIARHWRTQINRALAGETVRVRATYPDAGKVRVVDEIVARVDVDGEPTGVVGVNVDVTEQQRQQQFDALLTEIATDLVSRSGETIEAAFPDALERITRFFGVSVGAICDLCPDNKVLRVTWWWVDPATGRDRPQALEFDVRDATGLTDRLRANEAVVVADASGFAAIDRTGSLQNVGPRPFAIVPIRQSEGWLHILGLAGEFGTTEWPAEIVTMLRRAATLFAGILARQHAEAERRSVERRMRDAQKLESLGALAGGIAHDFNNLLTAILGHATLLRADLQAGPSLDWPLEQIELAARRAAGLCRQMLAYAGRGRFALQSLDLNSFVRESESLLRVSVPKKATLDLQLDPALPNVLADPTQLRQVVVNLVVNAAEAIGDAEGRIRLRTGTVWCTAAELARSVFSPQLPEGRYVRLAVIDTGIGMTAETISRIFDPFFSTKFTGRGLGLAAVVGIVRAHKGALRVESTPGQGSTFELLLPVSEERGANAAETTPQEPADAGLLASWRPSGTVLVVDDEAGVRELVRAVLQKLGFSVIVAQDGKAAVDLFEQRADDLTLAIVDLTMPGLDGRETLAAMRQRKPELPAILMSGYTRDGLADLPTEFFLQKPFTPVLLRQIVWKALQGVG